MSHWLWGIHTTWNGVRATWTLDCLSLSASWGWVPAVEYMKATGVDDAVPIIWAHFRCSAAEELCDCHRWFLLYRATYPWLLSDFRHRCSRACASSGSPQANTSMSVAFLPMCFLVVGSFFTQISVVAGRRGCECSRGTINQWDWEPWINFLSLAFRWGNPGEGKWG